MSAPIQNRDKLEGLQQYAPPWAREQRQAAQPPQVRLTGLGQERVAPLGGAASAPAPTLVDAVARVAQSAMVLRAQMPPEARLEAAGAPDSQRSKAMPQMPQGVGGPNLEWQDPTRDWPSLPSHMSEPQSTMKALRRRLSLEPQHLPEPVPVRERHRTIMPLVGRLGLVMVVAAVVAYGITLMTVPELRSFKPISFKQVPGVATAVEPGRLVIEGRQAFANEPLSLGVSLNGATGGEFALLTGLASGTRLSAGKPFGSNGWRLAARDLASAFAFAPRDFIGVMDTAIDVRTSSDMLIDRNVMRLEWIGKPQPALRTLPPSSGPEQVAPVAPAATPIPVIQPIDGEELATLLKRGEEYLRSGDIAAARLVLRRAANAGNAQAALTLGATFDPIVFGELGVLGFTSDAVQARAWYERAEQLGSPEAAHRIERLSRVR